MLPVNVSHTQNCQEKDPTKSDDIDERDSVRLIAKEDLEPKLYKMGKLQKLNDG